MLPSSGLVEKLAKKPLKENGALCKAVHYGTTCRFLSNLITYLYFYVRGLISDAQAMGLRFKDLLTIERYKRVAAPFPNWLIR